MYSYLSSDVLESQFGPTEIDVLYQDESERIIFTKLIKNGQILEISQVKFLSQGPNRFPEIHKAVVNGQSMGKAFRNSGVEFEREIYASFKYELPANFQERFQNDQPATVLGVKILIGPQQTPYADILETYHPDVNWGQLTEFEVNKVQKERIKLLDNFLATL